MQAQELEEYAHRKAAENALRIVVNNGVADGAAMLRGFILACVPAYASVVGWEEASRLWHQISDKNIPLSGTKPRLVFDQSEALRR